MGVIFTKHLADHLRTLAGLAAISQSEAVHTVEDPPLHGLQTVPRIGEGTRHNHGHRIVDVRTLHLLVDIHLLDDTAGNLLFVFDIIHLLYLFHI